MRQTLSPLDHQSNVFAFQYAWWCKIEKSTVIHSKCTEFSTTKFSDENFQAHRGLPPKQITDSESLRCQLSQNTFTVVHPIEGDDLRYSSSEWNNLARLFPSDTDRIRRRFSFPRESKV